MPRKTDRNNFNRNGSDFPPKVKLELEQRVNGHCSKPDCRKSTRGPKLGEGGSALVGQAAHITAAMPGPGAARYDPSLTSEKRRSIDNGIWLCNLHAREIDVDSERYPVAVLKEWKRLTEAWAHEELGKPPITAKDVQDNLAMVMQAGGPAFVRSGLANAVAAAVTHYQHLDPRFRVHVDLINGREHVNVRAVEAVSLEFVARGAGDELSKAFAAMIKHGDPVRMAMSDLEVTGSPLVAHLLAETGTIIFEASGTSPAECTLLALTANAPPFNVTFSGQIGGGTETVQFIGTAYDGLLDIELRCRWRESVPTINATMHCDFAVWNGKALDDLPYFDKLARLFETARSANEWTLAVELQGKTLLGSRWDELPWAAFWENVEPFINYFGFVRDIARHQDKGLIFDHAAMTIDADDYRLAATAARVIRAGGMVEDEVENATAAFTLEATLESLQALSRSGSTHEVAFEQRDGDVLNFAGQELTLPRFRYEFPETELCAQGVVTANDGESLPSLRFSGQMKSGIRRVKIIGE